MKRKYYGQKCPVEGCGLLMSEIGFCTKHAQRFRRYGDPNYLTPEIIRGSNSRIAQLKNRRAKKTSYLKNMGRHEHRVVMEKHLGRALIKGEIVHHLDGDKHNNSIENLQLMTQSEHIALHREELKLAKKPKTHCLRGHPLIGDNISLRGLIRICKTCQKMAQYKYRSKKCKQDHIN